MENDQQLWGSKRYHSLDYDLKQRFGGKIAKLPLDAGFTCPTRDGTKGYGGCLFCSSRGSGDFTKPGDIRKQMESQAETISRKWKSCGYVAYFQSYTNTYAPVDTLKRLFDEALAFPKTVGLAVATRCDCLPPEVLDLLAEYHKRTFLWVELGLQTTRDDTGAYIRRGFATKEFDDAVRRLNERGILSAAHLIAGLPGEDRTDFLYSVMHLADLPVWGVKLQMLHVLRDSGLFREYCERPFKLPDRDDYVELVCDSLERLRPDMVVHRLTGDGNRENLVAPLWTADKRKVLTEIEQELQRRKSCQGKYFCDLPVRL